MSGWVVGISGAPAQLVNLRRGVLEMCVLAVLDRAPAYGLDIARALSADGMLLDSEGTLYPLLARLRAAGWVSTRSQPSSQGPPRRYYELSSSGRAALAERALTWRQFTAAVDDLVNGGPTCTVPST